MIVEDRAEFLLQRNVLEVLLARLLLLLGHLRIELHVKVAEDRADKLALLIQ